MVRPSAHSFAFLLILLLFVSGCTGLSRPDFIILDQNVTGKSCDNNADCNITGNIFDATGHHTSAYSAGTNLLLDTADENKFSFNDKNFLDTDNNYTGSPNFGNTTTFFGGIANNGCQFNWEDGNAILRCPIISVFEIRSETVKDINTLGNIIPAEDSTFDLGNPSRKWDKLWVDDANVIDTINTTDIYLDRIRSRVNDVFINPGPDGGAFTNFFILNRDSGVLQSFMGVSSDESFTEFVEMGLDVPAAIAEIDTNLRWLMLTADDSVGTSQKFLVDNVVAPQTDASHDLGGLAIEMDGISAQRRWRDLYLSGTANVKDVNATGDITAVNITATNDLNSPRINTADLNAQDATIDTKGILKVNPAHLAIVEGDLDFDANTMRLLDFFNGVIIETIDVNVISPDGGSTVDLNLGRQGGGDLNVTFSSGFFELDTTPPLAVQLSAGSDTSPTLNYVFVLESNKTLTASTTGFPSAEHANVATVLVQSATGVEQNGAYKVHVYVDHTADINSTSIGEGHLAEVNEWIRAQHATWIDGVVPTVSIATRSGINDQVDFSSTSGNVRQLHSHVFPDFNTGTDANIFVVNDSSSTFIKVTDLNGLLTDSDGDTMSNKFFSLVIWGVVSEKQPDSKLMLNLPSGSYNKQQDAIDDVSGFDNFNIPSDFKGTGFLIARITFKHSVASGGTWTLTQLEDLRGQFPSTFAGGTASVTTQFADNTFLIFDETDVTKILNFQLETITTGNTRTITMSDRDLNLDDLLLTDLNALRDINANRGIQSPKLYGGNLMGSWTVPDFNALQLRATQMGILNGADDDLITLTANNVSIAGTITSGDITIFDSTPILVFQDSDSLGAASVGFIEWRDSGGGRAGFLGNNTSGNDDFLWKNEQGGNIGIQTTGAGELQIFANIDAQDNNITTTGTGTFGDLNALRDVNADRGIASPAFFGGSLRGAWAVGGTLDTIGDITMTETLPRFFLMENDQTDKNWRLQGTGGIFFMSQVEDNKTVIQHRLRFDSIASGGDTYLFDSNGKNAIRIDGATADVNIGLGDLIVDDGNALVDGFIGIQTLTPLSELQIGDGSTSDVQILVDKTGVTSGQPQYSFIGDPNTGMFSNAANSLRLSTSSTVAVSINSSQDVDITTGNLTIAIGDQNIEAGNLEINDGNLISGTSFATYNNPITPDVSNVIVLASEEPGAVMIRLDPGFKDNVVKDEIGVISTFLNGRQINDWWNNNAYAFAVASTGSVTRWTRDELLARSLLTVLDNGDTNIAGSLLLTVDSVPSFELMCVGVGCEIRFNDRGNHDWALETTSQQIQFRSRSNDTVPFAIGEDNDVNVAFSLTVDEDISVAGQRTYDTNVIKATFHARGLADSVATDVFRIETTNETGSNDGGSYSIVVVATATQNNEAAEANDGSVRGYSATFSHINVGSGVDSETDVVDIYETDPSANVGGPPDDVISDVNMTVNEISNYIHDLQFTIAQGGNNPTANSGAVVMEVELIWRGYLTPPTMTQIVT